MLDFYPFGLQQQGEGVFGPVVETSNRFNYNGKEQVEETGLLDYGARWYDPATARWGQIDPLAGVIPGHSAYAYTFNNPISFNDPTGMMGENPFGLNSSTNSTQTDKDASRQEVKSNQSNQPLEVLIYNDPNAKTRLSTTNLTNLVDETSNILSLNGVSENVNYSIISDLDDAPKTAFHEDRILFLALTNKYFLPAEGGSTPSGNKSGIAFYSNTKGNIYFHSGLETDMHRSGNGIQGLPMSRSWYRGETDFLAYSAAHELFHQLDLHARNAISGNMASYPSDGHYSSNSGNVNILNPGGAYAMKGKPGVGDSYRRLPEGVRRRIIEYLYNR